MVKKITGYFTPGEYYHVNLNQYQANLNFKVRPCSYNLDYSDSLVHKYYNFKTDINGFITSNFIKKSKKNIYFIGGSTTECMYVDENSRFVDIVNRNLILNDLDYSAYNAGFFGNTVINCNSILLNKLLYLKPDYCILMENINDLYFLLNQNNYRRSSDKLRNFIFKNSEFKKISNNISSGNYDLIKDYFKSSLVSFIDISRNFGITPILMTQANRFVINNMDPIVKKHLDVISNYFGINHHDFINLYKDFNIIIRECAKIKCIQIIDLDNIIPKSSNYLYDSVHYNNYGSVFAGNIIFEKLHEIF